MPSSELNRWKAYWRSDGLKRRVTEWIRRTYFAPVFAKVVRRFLPAGIVLEAGCGSGQILRGLRNHTAFGCDFTLEAARNARRHCRGTVVCDIARLPFRDSALDLVYNQGVMEHFKPDEFDQILKEFGRVSGRVLIIVPASTSGLRLYNPYDDLDGQFFTRREVSDAIGRTFGWSRGCTLRSTLGLSVAGYGERY